MVFIINNLNDTEQYRKMMCELTSFSCIGISCNKCVFYTNNKGCNRHKIANLLKMESYNNYAESPEEYEIIFATMWEITIEECCANGNTCAKCNMRSFDKCIRFAIHELLKQVISNV